MKTNILIISGMLLSTTAFADSFVANDSRTNAMGGAGVAAALPAQAINLNPGLLANYDEDEKAQVIVLGAGAYSEDQKGLFREVEKFIDELYPSYEDLEDLDLSSSIDGMVNTANNVETAVQNYEDDPSDANLAALKSANADLDSSISTVRSDLSDINSIVAQTRDTFESFSSRPSQAGVMGMLGIGLPSKNYPFALAINTNAYAGGQFNLVDSDLEPTELTLNDLDEYLNLVSDVSTSLDTVIEVADTYDAGDSGSVAAYDAAQTDFSNAVNAVDNANTSNGVFVNGDYDGVTQLNTDDFKSSVDLVGVWVTELSFAMGRDFKIAEEEFSGGAAVKMQKITVFEKNIIYSEIENDASQAVDEAVNENQKEYYRFNADLGVVKSFDYKGQITAGLVIKNIVPWDLESNSGQTIKLRPQVRIGAAHQTRFTTLVADLDVTENKPMDIGVATRYLSLGAEVNAYDWAAFRIGYKNNLSESDSSAVSLGLGLTPFGVGFDVSVWGSPSDKESEIAKNAGVMAQLSIRF
ncbi:conjugal transfer protein TraF [Gynuella sp.]|uniref:conjugal transfer protein TraF n=1 Tax=Gynuella sp. TaxID=2969146 RepID=UPI003D0B3A0D